MASAGPLHGKSEANNTLQAEITAKAGHRVSPRANSRAWSRFLEIPEVQNSRKRFRLSIQLFDQTVAEASGGGACVCAISCPSGPTYGLLTPIASILGLLG